jgi:hypothetical protein
MRTLLSTAAVFLLIFSQSGWSKDLSQRLGVGYTNDFGVDESMPSIAVRYYPNQQYGFQGSVGVDTETGQNRFGAAAKFLKTVFHEDNMNFYVAAGGGLVSREQNNTTSSGIDTAATFGGEFFLPGLESLGFNFEAGVGLTSVSSDMRFRTIGESPLNAGIFFYF